MVVNRERERAQVMADAITDSGNVVASPWVLDPYKRHDPSVLDVFDRDWQAVRGCDLVVADASRPSTGVGMEVMAAYFERKRIVVVAKRGSTVSGMLMHMRKKEFLEFDSDEDLYSSLRDLLEAGRINPSSGNQV